MRKPFNLSQNLKTEGDAGNVCDQRRVTCTVCNEVIYDVPPRASKACVEAEWKKMALHLALMHDCQIVQLLVPKV